MELNRGYQDENEESQTANLGVELANRNPPIINDLARPNLREDQGEYGEYFMPVNQHKKSFRGEKLYVTKDGRKKGGYGRLCWWILALLLLAVAIIIAVLIGTGVIDPNRSGPGVRTVADHDDRNKLDVPKNIVPNVFHGEMKIVNMNWTEELDDPNSDMFKTMASELEAALANLTGSNSTLNVKVTKFLSGSIIVQFTIGEEPHEKDIDQNELFKNLIKSLKSVNTSSLVKYEIPASSVSLDFVSDNCSSMPCSGGCKYNYTVFAFHCTCPEQLILVDNMECVDHVETASENITNGDNAKEEEENYKTLLMIKESIKLINKTIQNIAPEGISDKSSERIKDIPKDFGNNLNKSIQEVKLIPADISTKELNLVDLPESSRVKQEVMKEYIDDEFDEETNIVQSSIKLSIKPEPQHLVLENIPSSILSENKDVNNESADVTTTDPVNIGNVAKDLTTSQGNLTENLDRGDHSKLLRITTEVDSSEFESTTESRPSTLHWVIQNSIESSKRENEDSRLQGKEQTEKEKATPNRVPNLLNSFNTTLFDKPTEVTEVKDLHLKPTTTIDQFNSRYPNMTKSEMIHIVLPNNGKFNSSYNILGANTNNAFEMNKSNGSSIDQLIETKNESSDVDILDGSKSEQIDSFQFETKNKLSHIDNKGKNSESPYNKLNESKINQMKEESSQENALAVSILNMLNSPDVKGLDPNTSSHVQAENNNLFTISIFLNNTLGQQYTESATSKSQESIQTDKETLKVDNFYHSETEKDTTNDNPVLISSDSGKIFDNSKDLQSTTNAETETSLDMSKAPVNVKSEPFSDDTNWTTKSLIGTSLKDLLNIRIQTSTEKTDLPNSYLETERKSVTSSFLYTQATSTTILASNTTSLFTEVDPSCSTGLVCAGLCLERHQVCDALLDCLDGEDEAQCSFPRCLDGEFQCLKGRCIPLSWECDGKMDCSAGEDEVACASSCSEGGILCREGKCVPERWRCDGTKDCGDGEDEDNCECGSNELRCELSGGCVELGQVCDGRVDCLDRSDEWNCLRLENSTLTIRSGSAEEWKPICFESWDNSLSDGACRQLGYAQEELTQFNVDRDMLDSQFWVRDTTVPYNKHLIQATKLPSPSGKCASKAKVDLSCKSFECGKWNLEEDPGTLLGNTSYEWPSLALLFNVRQKTTCTLTIFSPVWLIASYSCVSQISLDPKEWVVFGGTPGSSPLGQGATQIKMVKTLVSHSLAKQGSHFMDKDYLLVELLQPLNLDSQVQASCLASDSISPTQTCLTAGWVRSQAEGVSFVQYVSFLPTPHMSYEECNSKYNFNGQVTSSMICSQPVQDTGTQPVAGSPLMCLSESGSWQLHGLLTYKLETRSRKRPLVFSSIIEVREWIDNTVGSSF